MIDERTAVRVMFVENDLTRARANLLHAPLDRKRKGGSACHQWNRGKVTILAGSQADTPLDAIAAVHPAMLSSADTSELKVPLGLYPSKDEPQDEYKKIVEIVSKKSFAAKNDHKFYDTFHGFAAARANLDDPKNKADFEDLYATLIKFFTDASAQ